MVDVGILGLDTSHGEAFAATLVELGASVTAVWDGGTVRDDAYVESICERFDAARYDDPAAIRDAVDAALVLTVDWDRHVPLAMPFRTADIPVLVDKPIAGSAAALAHLDDAGQASVFGGSALPYHPDFAALRGGGANRTLHLAGYNDFFYYRVHLVDAARHLAESDWRAVRPVADTNTSCVQVRFDDGTWATLRFDGPTEQPAFGALAVGDRTQTATVGADQAALDAMYKPFLNSFLDVVRGDVEPPTATVLNAARLSLAVESALETGTSVEPGDETDLERPAAAFVADYEPYY